MKLLPDRLPLESRRWPNSGFKLPMLAIFCTFPDIYMFFNKDFKGTAV